MTSNPRYRLTPIALLLLIGMVGCTQEGSAPATITASSGAYKLDPAHATLQFSVLHMGLSNYIAGFTDYTVNLSLDSTNPDASSVEVTINPASIRTDFRGDYNATHPKSAFTSWEQDLAMSDKFFDAATYPEITYVSTAVSELTPGTWVITGNLTLLGQTHPVELQGKVVGNTDAHPFTNRGALGFSITGTFKRSTFGMDHLLSPPLVGDDVVVMFEGEMHQAE
jgi:polyisoprenoid-binding protein YceI